MLPTREFILKELQNFFGTEIEHLGFCYCCESDLLENKKNDTDISRINLFEVRTRQPR